MKNNLANIILISLLLFASQKIMGQLTPQAAIKSMVRGINIGNTMEPPVEGTWGNHPVQEYAFDDYKNAGFTAVRIPMTWNGHTSQIPPYTITKSWLDSVEQVVDWGLKRKLFIIINAHHEDWIKSNYNAANKARFDSIWSQISVRLKDKSDSLLFEIINEPYPISQVNIDDLNKRILSIIRKTNPTRIVIFSGNQWANSDQLVIAKIPDPNDKYLIGYYHSYDPYPFGLNGPGTYGSAADINTTKAKFDQVTNWSTKNNIPVMLSEFGAQIKCDYNSRMTYYATVVDQALRHGVAFDAWDDNGSFPIYARKPGGWNEIKDILIHTDVTSPNQFKYVFSDTTAVTLNWTNRTTANDSIIVDRGLNSASNLTQFAKLSPTVSQFIDPTVVKGNVYYYRLRTDISGAGIYSYPIRTDTVGKKGIKITDVKNEPILSNSFNLYQNYPNPFNPSTTIKYSIPAFGTNRSVAFATLKVFDLLGREVAVLVNDFKQPGAYTVQWNATNFSSGIYIYRLQAGSFTETKKLVLLK
jgi:aryl-phospho-beta-D-glucosidase BglC (GH1 family)